MGSDRSGPDMAKQAQQQQIDTEHLMRSLLEQEGLATSVFNKADVPVQKLRDLTEQFIAGERKVSGASSSVYLGRSLISSWTRRKPDRESYDDDYISIEHLLLGYAKTITGRRCQRVQPQ